MRLAGLLLVGGFDVACDSPSEPSKISPQDSGAEGAVDAGADSAVRDSATSDARDADAGDAGAIVWTNCVDPANPAPPAHGCTVFELPLDYDAPTKGTVRVTVDRRLPTSGQSSGQVFMLQGGPGFPTVGQLAGQAAVLHGGPGSRREVYRIDQRGVAGPDALPACPELDRLVFPDEAAITAAGQACAARLDSSRTPYFSAASQGRDVGEIIARLRDPSVPAFLYGASYGTRWALRYLQQFPDQVDGVILDGLIAEDVDWTIGFAENRDNQMRWLLEACGADSFCSGKLGPDPVQKLVDVIARTDGGWCPTAANITPAEYREMFNGIYAGDPRKQALLAALVYRVDRCNAADEAAIVHSRFTGHGLLNLAQHYLVALSELIPEPPPSLAEVRASEALWLSPSQGSIQYRVLWDVYPRYPRGPLQGAYPAVTTPILMLHGTADGNTPYTGAEAVAAALAGPHQTLVTFPGAAHGVINFTRATDSNEDCGARIAAQFLADPTATLDTSCTRLLSPIDFETIDAAQEVFGTPDAWEG